MSFQMTSHAGHPKPEKSCVFNDCIIFSSSRVCSLTLKLLKLRSRFNEWFGWILLLYQYLNIKY